MKRAFNGIEQDLIRNRTVSEAESTLCRQSTGSKLPVAHKLPVAQEVRVGAWLFEGGGSGRTGL
jgi:hypothetical protein